MTEPDPKVTEFAQEHDQEIKKMMLAENNRRIVRNLQPLSREEAYDAVCEMRALVSQGQRIRAFRFPNAGIPIEPQRDTQRPTDPRQPMQRKPQASNNSYAFEAVFCANGFLLNVASAKGPQSFIFKTEDDLMTIFRETVFAEIELLKTKKQTGEVTNEPRNQVSGGDAGRRHDQHEDVGNTAQLRNVEMGQRHRRHRRRWKKQISGGSVDGVGKEGDPGESGEIHQSASPDTIPPQRPEGDATGG